MIGMTVNEKVYWGFDAVITSRAEMVINLVIVEKLDLRGLSFI